MRPICIYHGGCTDGVAAAWAMWRALPDAEYFPGVYQTAPPFVDNRQVFLLDFSYKRPVMEKIAALADTVTVLDHHKTARDDLLPLFESGLIEGEFDMDRCGALMAWDWFNPTAQRPALLQHIDAQDRWLSTRDAPLIIALRSYPHAPRNDSREALDELMKTWGGFMTDEGLAKLRADGAAIFRYYRARVDETKPHATTMTLGEYENVPVVNAPFYLASDVAGELAQDAPDGIAAVWWQNKDGSKTYSLRSRGDVDVGVLATQFGGGGHPGAAGFKEGRE